MALVLTSSILFYYYFTSYAQKDNRSTIYNDTVRSTTSSNQDVSIIENENESLNGSSYDDQPTIAEIQQQEQQEEEEDCAQEEQGLAAVYNIGTDENNYSKAQLRFDPAHNTTEESRTRIVFDQKSRQMLIARVVSELTLRFQHKVISAFVSQCIRNVNQRTDQEKLLMERISCTNDYGNDNNNIDKNEQEKTTSITDFVDQCINNVQLFNDAYQIIEFVDRCIFNVIVKQNLAIVRKTTPDSDSSLELEDDEEERHVYKLDKSSSFYNRLYSCCNGQLVSAASQIPDHPEDSLDSLLKEFDELKELKELQDELNSVATDLLSHGYDDNYGNQNLPFVYGALGNKKKKPLDWMKSFVQITRSTLDNYSWIGL